MPITLNYTTIEDCESKNNLSAVGDGGNIDDSDYPPKQGSQCVEFTVSPNSSGGVKKSNDVTAYDSTLYDTTVWLLNPVVDENGKRLVKPDPDGIVLRLYSSSGNYADYYQPEHRAINGEWNGGWMLLRGGGDAGTEDANSGTWTSSDAKNIVNFAVIIKTDEGDSSQKNSAPFGIDWAKRHNAIVVTGDNDGDPYTANDIFEIDGSSDGGGEWGLVSRSGRYFSLKAGLVFGDGSVGKFETKNEYIYIDNRGASSSQSVVVKSGFEFTVGTVASIGSGRIAKDGSVVACSVFSDGLMGAFVVESGAQCKLYDLSIVGFDRVELSSDNIDAVAVSVNDSSPVVIGGEMSLDTISVSTNEPGPAVVVNSEPSLASDIVASGDVGIFFDGAGGEFYGANLTSCNKSMRFNSADSVTVDMIDSEFDPSTIEVV